MMLTMRTTLTLDDDVAELVRQATYRDQRTMKDVVNDALRAALSGYRPAEPYVVHPHHGQLRPGIDPARLNQLADELSDDAQIAAMRRAGT